MRVSIAKSFVAFLAASLFNGARASLRGYESAQSSSSGRGRQDGGGDGGPVYHFRLSEMNWTQLEHGLIKIQPANAMTDTHMQFAEVQIFPGGVRDLHWHRTAAEWAYIPDSSGRCEFTLMDDHNRYGHYVAHPGTFWYFPLGWYHSVQAIDHDRNCTTLLWFDDKEGAGSINLSDMMAGYPYDVAKPALNDIPQATYDQFPDAQNSVARGVIQPSTLPPVTDDDKILEHRPLIPVDEGTTNDSGEGGLEQAVRQEQFPGTYTMSGGVVHLEAGGMRELHWHTNADEMHYVVSGKVRNVIHSNIGGLPADTVVDYTIEEGDVGYVPKNFVHYLEAIDGPATIAVTFNHPSWGTQGFSGMMSVTPSYISAATLHTTEADVDMYFPKESVGFVKRVEDGKEKKEADDLMTTKEE